MTASARRFDAVVLGGGHNGLTCAAYLAGAGLSVCVVERRAVLGGAAVTEEFHPGFRNSTASYTVSLLDPQVIRDLRLAEHGLTISERPFANFLPLPDGQYLKVGGGLSATQGEVAKFSAADARALPDYYAMLDRVADRCCARCSPSRRRTFAPAMPRTWPRSSTCSRSASTFARCRCLNAAIYSISSPRAPATCSTAGSRARRSRRPSASTRSWATSPARIRPARPTSCCTTFSVR